MNADGSIPETDPSPPDPAGGNRLSLIDKEIEQEKGWHAHRRRLGPVLGAALGLVFGLVSQYGNAVLVPGIPLYHPLFGSAGNLLFCVAIGLLLGLLTAWPNNAFVGTIAGCFAGALLFEVAIILTGENTPNVVAGKTASILLTFLPLAAILALPIGIFRWVVNKEEEVVREGASTGSLVHRWRISVMRLLRPVLLIVTAAAWGALFLYPTLGRTVLPRMNAIVQAGLTAIDRPALPSEFQTIDVPGYPQQAKGGYTLDWQGESLGRFAIPRPIEDEEEQSAVIARFESGWSFVCLFITADAEPRCAPLYVEP
jgi:hypothetical protein